jgi:hypothetical protein
MSMRHLGEFLDPLTFKLAALGSSAASGAASLATVDLTMGLFGVPLSVFLAGFAGALVSLSFLPPPAADLDRRKNVMGMAGHVFSGTLLAAFIEPMVWWGINNYLKPATPLPETLSLGIAGLLGALVMLLLPIGIQWVRKFTGAPV